MATLLSSEDDLPLVKDDTCSMPEGGTDGCTSAEDFHNTTPRPYQSVKREKSRTDSIEREKKRVKFSPIPAEYQTDSKSNKTKARDRGIRIPGKLVEKGILKNHNTEKSPYKKGIFEISMDNYLSQNNEGSVSPTTTSAPYFNETNEPVVSRENTFTKEDPLTLEPFQSDQIYSRDDMKNTTNKYSNNQSTNCGKDVSGDQTSCHSTERREMPEAPPRRRRTTIVPKEAKHHPKIINVKERKGPLCLKRNLPRDKENDVPAKSSEQTAKEPCRNCLKPSSDRPLKEFVKKSNDCKRTLSNQRVPKVNIESRELRKGIEENQILKDHNKNLEERLKEQNGRERDLTSHQRALKEHYEMEASKIARESKREARILLSELKSKERLVANLEKALLKQTKENPKKPSTLEANSPSKGLSLPRPKLTRSVSAASAIAKKSSKPQVTKINRSLKKNDSSSPPVSNRKRDELSGKGSGTERRYISKLEQMRKQIENQHRQIIDLNERLRNRSPNLKSLSQLSVSVPTIYEGEGKDQISRSTSKQSCVEFDARNESSTPIVSALCQPPLQLEDQIRSKEIEYFDPAVMATNDDIRTKSLDLFGSRYSSMEQPSSLRYSSLVSLNGSRREAELLDENDMLRAELQETRDHAELLEFRILEFTEGIQGATSVVHATCDQSTNTHLDDVTTPPPISEDLSLPLSVDSGLELNIDVNKSRLSVYRKSLARLEEAAGLSESSSVAQLSSLLDWVSSIYGGQHYDLPMNMSPRSPVHKKMGLTGLDEHRLDENLCGSDLTMLAAKLQETLTDPKAQEEVLEETIVKLRLVSASLSRLQSRVTSLTLENKDLQETITALHDSHETRTEASGTESELVHGKSPSLHSDLSDSESDDSSRPTKAPTLETATSFQESGIFETSCEMVNTATQTCQDFGNNEESPLDQDSSSLKSETLHDEGDPEKLEVDLQTALARLTSIKNVVQGKELRNLRLQDLQESDEYLVAALEGEKVTLCKIEYDTIVATERSLQSEIEMLQYEKEQLALQCATLEEKLEKVTNSDVPEVLKAQVRLLEERLEISERQRKQHFEDKCEYEEAENDARLHSQRLESQLEAAREMESLLSASLSQEQEFCRELQRKVREMQEIDKGRRIHEGVLEKESQFCRRREAALMVANDNQKSQLTFALYGLILAQFWRRMASRNREALVPFTSLKENAFVVDLSDVEDETFPLFPTFPCDNECQRCLDKDYDFARCVNVCDACTQTLQDFDHGEEHDSAMKRLRPLHTEPLQNEDLSDREQFYLSQIEALQKERKSLREDYETEQSMLTQQLHTIKNDVEIIQQNLEESQKENCKLLFKLEEAQKLMGSSDVALENQAKELKREFHKSVEVYQQEQKAMQDGYEERISELRRNLEFHEQRFTALLQQYSILQHELEPYFQSASDCVDDYSGEEGSSSKILTTKDLLSAVRELVRAETSAKQKLNELEKKESAYRETINEADRIMSNHVTIYTRQIEELEASLEQKCLRIKQLEKSEDRLRTTMKNSWKSGEGSRITELLDRLIETENSELNLKERVWNLERNGKELQIKFAEAEKAQENLRSELRDQEELVQRLMSLTSENNALTSQLQEAHEAARRASDIQQSENYLKNRVDELEASESGLRDVLKQTDLIMKQKERKFRDQVANMEEEILSLRNQLDQRINEMSQSKEIESSLRHQIENYKRQIQNLEKELKESSSENICHETQHRSEVTKLRSQLKLVNSQLTDLDTLNGELKERLTGAESAMKEVAVQLEETTRRHEKEVLSFNLQMSQKDSKIEEYEAQLQQLSHTNVVGELDFLASSPVVSLQTALNSFIKNSKMCEECSKHQNSSFEILNDCLKTLNELINGRSSQSDSEIEDFESTPTDNLANEPHSTTSPPNPAQEGLSENSSGDADTISVCSSTATNERDTNAPTKEMPPVPPRPRRDAMKKRKIRKSVKNEGSLLDELEYESSVEKGSFYGNCPPSVAILEELEEKVRELEEAVARKDEELRLADGEAAELHLRLMEEDGKLSKKTEEASLSSEAVISLRQQLLMTVQEYEGIRHAMEDKHKVDIDKLTKKIENLTEDLLRLSKKAILKDRIIGSLVKQIRSILRSGSTAILVNQIKKLKENPQENGSLKEGNGRDVEICDYDVETLCAQLEQPYEVYADFDSKSMSCHSLPSLSSPVNSTNVVKKSRSASETESTKGSIGVSREKPSKKACVSSRGNLPPLEPNRKSRIPRFRPFSGPPLKHDDCPVQRLTTPKHLTKQNRDACLAEEVSNSKPPPEPKQELKPLAKVVPKQRPMAKVTPKPKTLVGEDSESKIFSDARKVRRMVTGLASVNASVDCSSAPEYKRQAKPPVPSCVPRPKDLRITRRVGIDGVVIAWSPLEHDCVAGFQVVVGGRVVQMVRSPHRTKALVTGLPFPSPFTIGLVAITEDGRCSTPTLVSYETSSIYKPKMHQRNPPSVISSNATTPRRSSVPTCL